MSTPESFLRRALNPETDNQLTRILRRLGVEPGPFIALLRSFVLMDYRNQQFGRATGSSSREILSPLNWVIGQNLLISLFLSGALYMRVEAFVFAFATMSVSALIIATSLVVEFNEVVFDVHDLEVIGHRPLETRTYSAARLTNLIGYLVLITTSTAIIPAFVGASLRDASYLFPIAFLISCYLFNMIVAGIVVVSYGFLIRNAVGRSASEVLAWTQAALMGITCYGGQAVLRDSQDRLELWAYHLPEWIRWTPTGLLAEFVAATRSGFDAGSWVIFLSLIPAVVFVGFVTLRSLSHTYDQILPQTLSHEHKPLAPLLYPGELKSRLSGLITREHEERTAYWLCSTMLRRDTALRMRSWPSFGIVIAVLALGIFRDELSDPLVTRGREAMVSIACIYLCALPIPTILYNMRFARNHESSWILRSAPISDPAMFVEGIRKAVTNHLAVPLVILLWLIFTWSWTDKFHAALHALASYGVIQIAGYASALTIMRVLPFSRSMSRGQSLSGIAPFLAGLSGMAMVMASAHYVASQDTNLFMGYLVMLFATVLLMRWICRNRNKFELL